MPAQELVLGHIHEERYNVEQDWFVPLQQLEDLAPGTWYVNVLATYPQYRGRDVRRYASRCEARRHTQEIEHAGDLSPLAAAVDPRDPAA